MHDLERQAAVEATSSHPKDEADLLAHLLTITPGFDYAQNANTKGLQQSPELQTYLRRHTRSGPYVWQWLKRPPVV